MITLRLVIRGVVQGVGFRYFVLGEAERRGITGRVWNRADGAVEVIAQHSDPAEQRSFESRMWTGPGAVASVESEKLPDQGTLEQFSITRAPLHQ